jgi:hypothetical protein
MRLHLEIPYVHRKWCWCGVGVRHVETRGPTAAITVAAAAAVAAVAASVAVATAAKLGGGCWWQPASFWTPLMVVFAVVVRWSVIYCKYLV